MSSTSTATRSTTSTTIKDTQTPSKGNGET